MGRRAPNGSSTIYLGKDGRWHTWVHAGTKPNGKADRRHIHRATATEVAEAAAELRERIARGNAPSGKIETVGDWLAHWLEHDVKPNKAWKTYTGYAGLINNYVIPNIGGWRLDGTRKRLEPEHVQAMYQKMARTPIVRGSRGKAKPPMLGASTIHKAHWILSSALDVAVRRGKTARNVCALIDAPSFRKTKVPALTLAETQAVIQQALTDVSAARWLTGLLLGPRQGETLGLRWPMVHLDPPAGEEPHIQLETQLQRQTLEHGCADAARCVASMNAERRQDGTRLVCRVEPCPPSWGHGCSVPAGCYKQAFRCPQRKAKKGCRLHTRKCPPLCGPDCAGHARHCPDRVGGLVEVELKSERSVRPIAMPSLIVDLLRQHRVRQQRLFAERGLRWTPAELVFTSPEGRPLDASRDHRAWEDLLRRAGVADAKLHAARHTAGTMLVATGADISVVQEVLGHTDIRTARIYVDVAKKTQREAFDRALSALTDGNLAALLQPNAATSEPKG